jgi:F-type H+-transporting ATPase subunit epsilon
MAETFTIEIATPERLLASEQAVRAQIPAQTGYIGVLPGHAPLLACLGIGALTYTTPEDHRYAIAIKSGFLEILDNHVRVLTDEAEKGQEIDLTEAEKALKKAQDEVINPAAGIDIAQALIMLRQAQARIDAARKQAAREE